MRGNRRVVVTGIGLVSPLGHTTEDNWNAIMEKRIVADRVKSFSVGDMPCQIAYEITDYLLDPSIEKRVDLSYTNRFTPFGIGAAVEAMEMAGLKTSEASNHDLSIVLGCGMGSPNFAAYTEIWAEKNYQSEWVRESQNNRPERLTHTLKALFGARRSVKTIHTACASSGQSLGEAFEMIRNGEENMILTGGADSMINPFHMAGFCLLGALSQRNHDPATASRPFDEGRNGFVLGEGAAMLVFEEYEHARNRGANILGEVCGYGISESAYRITDLHPEGRGPIEAMKMAVDNAGIDARDVGYVNAHGTSTLLNDRIESLAIYKTFGNSILVSSTKSMTGHTISAAGAMEFALTMMSMQRKILMPTANIFSKDPQCAVSLTPSEPKEHVFQYGLSNSVGFGGSNTALIAGRLS